MNEVSREGLPHVTGNRCGVHSSCAGCSSLSCSICLCDACDGYVCKEDRLDVMCGCVYHKRCSVGANETMDACRWCQPRSQSERTLQRILPQGLVTPAPYLSREKIERRGWRGKDVSGRAYTWLSVKRDPRLTLDFLFSRGLSLQELLSMGFTLSSLFQHFYPSMGPSGEFLRQFKALKLPLRDLYDAIKQCGRRVEKAPLQVLRDLGVDQSFLSAYPVEELSALSEMKNWEAIFGKTTPRTHPALGFRGRQ